MVVAEWWLWLSDGCRWVMVVAVDDGCSCEWCGMVLEETRNAVFWSVLKWNKVLFKALLFLCVWIASCVKMATRLSGCLVLVEGLKDAWRHCIPLLPVEGVSRILAFFTRDVRACRSRRPRVRRKSSSGRKARGRQPGTSCSSLFSGCSQCLLRWS